MVSADLDRVGFVRKVQPNIYSESKVWSASILIGCILGAGVICAVRSCGNTVPIPAGVESAAR